MAGTEHVTEGPTDDPAEKPSRDPERVKMSRIRQDFSQLPVGPAFQSTDLQPPGGLFDDSIWESVDTVESEEDSESGEMSESLSDGCSADHDDDDKDEQSRDHVMMTSQNDEVTDKRQAQLSGEEIQACDDIETDSYSRVSTQDHADYMTVEMSKEDVTDTMESAFSPQQPKTSGRKTKKHKTMSANSAGLASESTYSTSVDDVTMTSYVEPAKKKAKKSAKHPGNGASVIEQHPKSSGLTYDGSSVEVVDLAEAKADGGHSKKMTLKSKKQTGIMLVFHHFQLPFKCLVRNSDVWTYGSHTPRISI